jgi:hypothetical protein
MIAPRRRHPVVVATVTTVAHPEAYASVDATPYVLAGPGPWAPEFEDALGEALGRAAVGG